MKTFDYQQKAVEHLTQALVTQIEAPMAGRKIVFDAPTGAGKTVMACQTLARLVDELASRAECRHRECAFIWFAPRQLHIQSYGSLRAAFGDTRKLRPVMYDELDKSLGIQAGEILFVNWESVNKEKNLMVRDSEAGASLYDIARRTREEAGLPIVAIIDEEHMFWNGTADKSAEVLRGIQPQVELRISATPRTTGADDYVKVPRRDVIRAGMIKKEVVLNPDVDVDNTVAEGLTDRLLRCALKRRSLIAEEYKRMGINLNPLLLIQLPNDKKPTLTAEDEAIRDQVKQWLEVMSGITVGNGKLAVWLAGEKSNLEGLERADNVAEALLFKEAIALGWDCPRAAVLLIFRRLQSNTFTVQTVGRIMRMPEQHHYPTDLLNVGYVYTNIAREQIEIIAADQDYILKNSHTARRRAGLHNVELAAVYEERPAATRNRLGPDFKNVFILEATNFWKLQPGAMLFSLAELAAMAGDEAPEALAESDDAQVNENRRLVANTLRLDVKTVNIEIPVDVHLQNEVQTIAVRRAKFARTAGEIDRVYQAYIATKGHQFEAKGRTDKIGGYLIEILGDLFGVFDTDAKKVVLYHDNKPKIDCLIDRVLARYEQRIKNKRTRAERRLKAYTWEVPAERVYDGETNRVVPEVRLHALEPFVRLKTASTPEQRFEAYLEAHGEKIDWWYKNGDSGRQHYSVRYDGEGGRPTLFYPDFVVRMKSGRVYIFDTKSAGSDAFAPSKHNALLAYMQEENKKEGQDLHGGIIIQPAGRDYWLYPSLPIENTTDLQRWDMFDADNA